jgi:hypothetical protein
MATSWTSDEESLVGSREGRQRDLSAPPPHLHPTTRPVASRSMCNKGERVSTVQRRSKEWVELCLRSPYPCIACARTNLYLQRNFKFISGKAKSTHNYIGVCQKYESLLKKDGEDQLYRLCKHNEVLHTDQEEKFMLHKARGRKECYLRWIHLEWQLAAGTLRTVIGWNGGEDEGEDVSRYCMILKKWEDSVIWKRTHCISLWGELAVEEVMALS